MSVSVSSLNAIAHPSLAGGSCQERGGGGGFTAPEYNKEVAGHKYLPGT